MYLPVSASARWLEECLAGLSLSEDPEGYLYGRGATEEALERLGVREWTPGPPAPDDEFAERYGRRGEKLAGWLVFPVRAPTGRLVGAEFRSWQVKEVAEYRLPEAAWSPFLINTPRVTERLAAGGSVWVVEGVYDLFALEWAVPPGDAVLSTLRAGLSRSSVEYIQRWCRNRAYMVYDNDETGRRVTLGWVDSATGKRRLGAVEKLTRAGVSAVDYRYSGKDPGEVWRAGGAAAVRREFADRMRGAEAGWA